jgi:hypothetical protein
MMIVASDGYIIDILGPYLADGKNNDAAILIKQTVNEKRKSSIKMVFRE